MYSSPLYTSTTSIVTKDVSTGTGTKQDKVIQNGQDGIKEITYKVKYRNEQEIEKIEISSKIITLCYG